MALTLEQLNSGIDYWQRSSWPQDFHNAFYEELRKINMNGFSERWWHLILPHLKRWKATRGKGKSDYYLTRRAKSRLGALKATWKRIASAPDNIASERMGWHLVEPFTEVVMEIKNVARPVFCSKLCHFVSPCRFPVIDKAAMGLPFNKYGDYWNFARYEWRETAEQLREDLIFRLQEAAQGKLHYTFPFACKITEICLIGKRNA